MRRKNINNLAGVIALTVMMMIATTSTAQRDTRNWESSHMFGLSFGTATWLDDQDASWGLTLQYDRKLGETNWWLAWSLSGANATIEEDFTQFLLGANMGIGYRLMLGPVFIHPRLYGGFGMVANNFVVTPRSGAYDIIESYPCLTFQGVARLDAGVRIANVCLGAYISATAQYAPDMPYSHSPYVTVEKAWKTYNPVEVGVTASYALDKGKKLVGGNNAPIVEGYGAYGSYGPEAGVKLIWSEMTGYPWLFTKESGLRNEMCASTQVIMRISETLGDVQRTCAQLGYGLLVHPWGPKSPLMGRVALYAGIGERLKSSAVSYVQIYQHDYNSESWGQLTGARGDVECDLSFHSGQFYATLGAGLSYTHINGTSTDDHITVDAQEFESPWGWKIFAGVGLAF